MSEKASRFSLTARTESPEEQYLIDGILKDLNRDFPFVKAEVTILSKKLVPYEIILQIFIGIVGTVTAEAIIRMLDWLWKRFKQSKIELELHGVSSAKVVLTDYLRSKREASFEMLRMQDKGLYVSFVVELNTRKTIKIWLSKTDLSIIRMEED